MLKFAAKWMLSHIEDGDRELKKPVLFTEFGLSNDNEDFEPAQRDRFLKMVLDVIYKSAKRNRSGAGSFFWQFLVERMERFNDEYGIVPWENPSTYRLITDQSCRLAKVQGLLSTQVEHLKNFCAPRN